MEVVPKCWYDTGGWGGGGGGWRGGNQNQYQQIIYMLMLLHGLMCFLIVRVQNFSSLKDSENRSLAPAMNGVVVHSRLVDDFEELLIQQADMSFIWYALTHTHTWAHNL